MASATSHGQSLATATVLTGYQVMKPIAPLDVISVLNRESISFVLVGAYGLAGWTKTPRATQDVDVIVAGRQHKKAVRALLAAFPDLDADDQEVVTRLRDRESQAVTIDVMKPNLLYRAAFKHTVRVEAGGQDYRIPSLEMALAMKFAPMVSMLRADEKKHIDAHDFIVMVKVNPDLDLNRLSELGELVYPGGGPEIVEMVRRVRSGERLQL
jgi:hypothetical protein